MEKQNIVNMEHNTDASKKQSGTKKKNGKIYVLIMIVLVLFLIVMKFSQYKKDIDRYSPEELESFLEYAFGQECDVSLNEFSYFMDFTANSDIPYIVDITLKDGTETFFGAYWERNSSIDSGISTDYGETLVEYYGRKYGIDYAIKQYWSEITLNDDDMKGNPSAFEQFMTDLYDSYFVQAGQDLELHIQSVDSLSYETVVLNGNESFDAEALINRLMK